MEIIENCTACTMILDKPAQCIVCYTRNLPKVNIFPAIKKNSMTLSNLKRGARKPDQQAVLANDKTETFSLISVDCTEKRPAEFAEIHRFERPKRKF